MKKVIIAGGRDFDDYDFLEKSIDELNIEIGEVVSGKAPGVDTLGEKYAESKGISVKEFPADWSSFGRAAGPIRNKQMAEYADVLVAFWDQKSKGTKSMINLALKNGLKVYIIHYEAVEGATKKKSVKGIMKAASDSRYEKNMQTKLFDDESI